MHDCLAIMEGQAQDAGACSRLERQAQGTRLPGPTSQAAQLRLWRLCRASRGHGGPGRGPLQVFIQKSHMPELCFRKTRKRASGGSIRT